ncbi:MAG: hypothetical protein LBP91_02075, partial [Coriobacteriales bacterium]|nr:hypothetical protein [Coriobacteriales bacterium]
MNDAGVVQRAKQSFVRFSLYLALSLVLAFTTLGVAAIASTGDDGLVTKAEAASWYGYGWGQSGYHYWYGNGYGYYYGGWYTINGHYYLFDCNGWMLTGWQCWNGSYYYLGDWYQGWWQQGVCYPYYNY